MIHDAKIEVECDHCGDLVSVDLPLRYPDFSGRNAYYPADDKDIRSEIESVGWVVEAGDDEDRHICEECAEEQ